MKDTLTIELTPAHFQTVMAALGQMPMAQVAGVYGYMQQVAAEHDAVQERAAGEVEKLRAENMALRAKIATDNERGADVLCGLNHS